MPDSEANHFGNVPPFLLSSLPPHPNRNRSPWKNSETNIYQKVFCGGRYVVESWGEGYGVSSTLLKEEVMHVMILFHESGYFFEVGGRKNSVEQIVDVSNGI